MREDIKERIELIKCGKVPEGYKKTKLGIIPKDWEIVQVQDVLEKVDNPVEVKLDEEYTQIGIRSHGKGIFYKEPVQGKELGNKRVFWVEPDCFVVNIVFAWERAVARTTQREKGMIASHRFPMYRSVSKKVAIDYLVQYFLTQKGKEIMEDASPGGAGRNRTLGQARFMKSRIVCPPLDEQIRIAEILKCVNKAIFLAEKQIEEQAKVKTYLLQNLLPGQKRVQGYDGKWNDIKLGNIIYDIDERTKDNNEFPVLTSSRKGLYFQDNYFKKKVASDNNIGYKIVSSEEFVYRTMSDDGNYTFNIQRICDKGIVSPAYAVFKPDEEVVDCDFLYYFMNDYSFNRYLQVLQQGGTRKALGFNKLCDIIVRFPQKDEQKKIASYLKMIDKELILLDKKLVLLKKEEMALMQLLLSGILRVNEI